MWNPESTDMESGLHSVESGIQDSLKLPYMGPRVNQFKELQRPPVKFSVKGSDILSSALNENPQPSPGPAFFASSDSQPAGVLHA